MSVRLLTAKDVAATLACSLSAAYEHMRAMRCVAVGRAVRVHPVAFAEWMRSHAREPEGGVVAVGDRALPPPIFPWPNTAGVYFVAVNDMVKIGRAADIAARLGKIQGVVPFSMHLLAVVEGGTFANEMGLHHRFAGQRLRGEWFKINDAIVSEIQRLRQEGS